MDGLTVLVEAKKEYLAQLCGILCPQMIETFEELYTEANKVSKGRNVLQQYQRLLQEVPNWNNHIIHMHSEKLTGTCGWFNDLVAAVFVSYVKILSSVRLNASQDKKISLKLPNNEVFIQGCYSAVAKDLYKDPYVYHDVMSEYERDDRLTRRFVACIEATVKEMLPVQEILKTYITQAPEQEIDMDAPEPEDPEMAEEEVPPVPEEETPSPDTIQPAEGAEIPAPPPANLNDPVPPIAPITPEDVKNIDVKGHAGDDDVLFPDARE